MTDKQKLAEFEAKLRDDRCQAVAKFLEGLSNNPNAPECEIFGKIMFKYDDGRHLIADFAMVRDPEQMEKVKEYYERAMNEDIDED